ncbi:MAG: hypothetical protein R3Y50_11030 [Rikenellaceae bacterium]
MSISVFAISCAKPIYLTGKTEYIEKVVIKDTTIFLEVEKQIIESIASDSSYLETEMANSFAKIDTLGNLYHTLEQKEQKIEKVVEFKERLIIKRDSIPYIQKVVETKEIKHIPKIFWISMVVSVFFLGRIVYKIWL